VSHRDRQKVITGAFAPARQVAKFPASQLWLDFDKEADVLYITLMRPFCIWSPRRSSWKHMT
jgi:hypothetical protein